MKVRFWSICAQKKAILDQNLTFIVLTFWAQTKNLLCPVICLKNNIKTKLDQNLTFKMAKIGPEPNLTLYIYIYVYISADESDNGTLLSQKQVKQRDARTLNNGTRPVSRYKNSGFALFWGGGGQLVTLGRRCD